MTSFISSLALLCLSLLQIIHQPKVWGESPIDPTEGFISLPLNRSFYHIQRPYDVPEDQRYQFIDGVHKLWVYSTDKPHTPTSQTKPRTEIAIQVGAFFYYLHCFQVLIDILKNDFSRNLCCKC